jgi:hypothetical protein
MGELLITVFVAVFTFLWYSRFRHITRWWKRAPTLRDRAFDLAELDLPDGWRPGHELNGRAGIEAVDLLHNRYVIVISNSRDDFDAELDLDQYAKEACDSITSIVRLLKVRGPERRKVDGCDAVQFEIEGIHEMTEIWYLVTVVMGQRAFHQIVTWAPRSAYRRKVFDEVVGGFRERPGAAAQPRTSEREERIPAARVIGFRPAQVDHSAAAGTAADAPRK